MTSPQANRITALALPCAASTSDAAPQGASAGSDAGAPDRGAHLPPATRSSLPGSSLRQRPRVAAIADAAQDDERARVLRVLERALGQPGKTNAAIAADFRVAARATTDGGLSRACDRAGEAFERDAALHRGFISRPVDPRERTRRLHGRLQALDDLRAFMRDDARQGVSALKAEVARLMRDDVLPRLLEVTRQVRLTWDIADEFRQATGARALQAALRGRGADIAAVADRMELRGQFVDVVRVPAASEPLTRSSFLVAAKGQLADTYLLAILCAAHVRAWVAGQASPAVAAKRFADSTAVVVNRNIWCDRLLDEANDACKAEDREAPVRLAAKEFLAVVVAAIENSLQRLQVDLESLNDLAAAERASGAGEAATALLDAASRHGGTLHRQLAQFGPMASGFFERARCEGELAPDVLQRALAIYARRLDSREDLLRVDDGLSPRAIVAQAEEELRAEALDPGDPQRMRFEFQARMDSSSVAAQQLIAESNREAAAIGRKPQGSKGKGRSKPPAASSAPVDPPSTMRRPLPSESATPGQQFDEAVAIEQKRLELAVDEASGEAMPTHKLVKNLLVGGLQSLRMAADAAKVAGSTGLVDEAAVALSTAELVHAAVHRYVQRRQFLQLPDKARYDAIIEAKSLVHAVPFPDRQLHREFPAKGGKPNEIIRETVLEVEESGNPDAPERLRRLPGGQVVLHVHEVNKRIVAAHFKRYADRRLGKVNDQTGQNVWRGHILGEHEFVRQVERTAPSPRSTSVQRLDGAGDAADQVARDQR